MNNIKKALESFKSNENSFFDGSQKLKNSSKSIELGIVGNFTFTEQTGVASKSEIEKMETMGTFDGNNMIIIGGVSGTTREYVNPKMDVMMLSVNSSINTQIHETLHLFGLADRYNYIQYYKSGNGFSVNSGYETAPMLLEKKYDRD
jgi:hypothetical protein